MSTSTTNLLYLAAKFDALQQQSSAPTANPVIANAIENYSNIARITHILESKKKEDASNLISEEDINTYFNNSSGDELERRIMSVFNCENAKIIDYINVKNLFLNIKKLKLFKSEADITQYTLIKQVLIAKAPKAIADLIEMDMFALDLRGINVEAIIQLLSSFPEKTIQLLMHAHPDVRAKQGASYFSFPETPRENSHNQTSSVSSRQRMHSPRDTPFKISNPLSPGFFTQDLTQTNTPKETHLPVSVKGSKIHLKIPKKHFSQWPPAPFAPITPSDQERRLDVAPK